MQYERVSLLAAIVDDLDEAVAGLAPDGTIFLWNPAAEQMFGYPSGEVVDRSALDLIAPEERDPAQGILRRAGRGDRVHGFQTRGRRRDGSEFEAEMTLAPLRDGGEDVKAVVMRLRDVTRQKQEWRRLRHFEALVEFSEDAILTKDLNGVVMSWNAAAERLYGYAAEEMVGKSVALLAPAGHADEIPALTRKVAKGRRVEHFETRRVRKDGTRVDVVLTLSPIRDADGFVEAVSVIARDITEAKRRARIHQHFAALVESSDDAIISKDLEGRVVTWNPAAERLYGYAADEIVDQPVSLLSPPNLVDEVPALTERIRRGRKVAHYETMRRRKDGSLVEVQLTLSPIRDEDDDIVGISVIARDISSRRQEERALRHFHAMVESSDDAIISKTLDNVVVSWNRGAERMYGYTAAEMVGNHIGRIAPPDRQEEIRQFALRLRRGERITSYETKRVRKDGRTLDVSVTLSPIIDDDGVITGISTIGRDITDVKRAEETRIAGEAAIRSSLAKSEFLANMSHEIRTPMNAIIGMADLLAATTLDEEQVRYVRIFREAGASLLTIVNDILDLSKVEAGEVRLVSEQFNLIDVVESVVEVLAVRAHEKGLELNVYVAPDLPTVLIGDPGRLRQILLNLVGNAVKFTDHGEVVLRVERDPQRHEPGVFRFSVSDTGVGIPPDKLDYIFEPFAQLNGYPRQGGTGLGLSISRRLVELMGGALGAQSLPAQGSTFWFTCRLGVAAVVQNRAAPPAGLSGMPVLVVDDNATNRLILKELLTAGGAGVTVAEDGPSGLERLRAAAESGAPFRVVLLDCRMPGMDGFQVAEAIQEDPALAGTIIMMLTSDQRRDDIDRVHDLGLAAYLIKPVRPADLYVALDRLLQGNGQFRPAPPIPAPSDSSETLRILLVDDEEVNRFLVQQYLRGVPCQLDVAVNGVEAVNMVAARTYDVILMDIRMPIMNGYEATRRIRAEERERGLPPTPIIALTASTVGEEIQVALETGCTAHVSKPVTRAELLSVLKDFHKHVLPE